MSNIHALSVVHPDAQIGNNVIIEPFAVIHEDVTIGDGTHIMSNVVIMPGTRIGIDCKIYPGAVVGAEPQDLKFEGEQTTLEIGDRVTIRECATLNRGTKAFGKTTIGNDTLIMAYVHVAHDCIIGKNVVLVNNVNLAGHVEVGDFAILSGLTAVHQFVKIGQHSMISGGSLVRKDIPPYIKVAREPLRYVGVNTIGLKRRGFNDEVIQKIQEVYKTIFVDHSNILKAIKQIDTSECKEKALILDFIKNSERGIIRGYITE